MNKAMKRARQMRGFPPLDSDDYAHLPYGGCQHYNLSDAALLSAFDMWCGGLIPDKVAPKDWREELDELQWRTSLEPLRLQLLGKFVQGAISGQLEVTVRRREWLSSNLLPDRTYVDLEHLAEWLRVHGVGPNDPISALLRETRFQRWQLGWQTATERQRWRLAENSDTGEPLPDDLMLLKSRIDDLQARVRQQMGEIRALEAQGFRVSSPTSDNVKPTERKTLLTLLLAACKKAGLEPQERGAAAKLSGYVDEIGASVSEDTALKYIKAINELVKNS